jgi:TusA-related sulfurtransferase
LSEKVDYRFDFRGAIKSLALLKLTRMFREMQTGETLEILGLDPDTRSDLFRLLPPVSYQLITSEEQDNSLLGVHLRKI